MKNIIFKGVFLSKDDARLNITEFKNAFIQAEESETKGSVVQQYSLAFEGSYLKINFSDGSALPRNPNVYNNELSKEEPNPRQPNQIETKEHFALIDFDTCLFWINNYKKQSILIDYIKSKFKNSIIVAKDVYDQEQFIETIKRLDDLRITATPELFSETHTLTKALTDELNQFEAPCAILHLKYQNKFVGNVLLDKIKSLIKNRNSIRGIMISGRDEKDNGMLFNSNIFSRKIEIEAHVNANEMFEPEEVFRNLIKKIENEKES
jgi:hypothetical protein